MKPRWLALTAAVALPFAASALISLSPAIGAVDSVTRIQNVTSGQAKIVARHAQWNRECKSLENPIVKIEKPPAHGKIGTGQVQFKAMRSFPGSSWTNCLGHEFTGASLSYTADAGFTGRDELLYRVIFTKRKAGAPKEFSYRLILEVAPPSPSDSVTPIANPKAVEPIPQPKIAIAKASPDQDKRVKQMADAQQQLQINQQHLKQQQSSTANELSQVEKLLGGIILPVTEDPNAWMMRVSAVPVQQQQFCRIVDRFYGDLAQVYQLHNDIKQNALFRDRKLDMAPLLPHGEFENWVVQVKEVKQAADGSAAVMLQPPCRAMLGSDACQKDGSKIRATIAADSPLYRELARVNANDFVVVSGKILYAESANPNQALPTYAVYEPGSHCSTVDGSKKEDVFVTEIRYLVQLR